MRYYEASDLPYQTDYNTDKMVSTGLDREMVSALASYIRTWIDMQHRAKLKVISSSCYGKTVTAILVMGENYGTESSNLSLHK